MITGPNLPPHPPAASIARRRPRSLAPRSIARHRPRSLSVAIAEATPPHQKLNSVLTNPARESITRDYKEAPDPPSFAPSLLRPRRGSGAAPASVVRHCRLASSPGFGAGDHRQASSPGFGADIAARLHRQASWPEIFAWLRGRHRRQASWPTSSPGFVAGIGARLRGRRCMRWPPPCPQQTPAARLRRLGSGAPAPLLSACSYAPARCRAWPWQAPWPWPSQGPSAPACAWQQPWPAWPSASSEADRQSGRQ